MITTITYSCTANFGEDSGYPQDMSKDDIIQEITTSFDIENNVLQENDQGLDCDDLEILDIRTCIYCMEDRSNVDYTIKAIVYGDNQ